MENKFNLNEEQIKPATTLDGRVLVLAGAGTGKTRVLTARIYNLLSAGVSPHNILAITFTNKAANEMKERISKINSDAYKVTACTFHSLCAKILRVEAGALGYSSNFVIYDEHDKEQTLKNIIKINSDIFPDENRRKAFLKAFPDVISKIKTYNYKEEDIRSVGLMSSYTGDEVLMLYLRYQEELKKSNAMDFDDLLLNVYKLFCEHKEILEKYQNLYKYIHVDEYQDTNKIQHKIVESLGAKNGNIFLVGDEDQGIYSWRGADISNILTYTSKYPDTKMFKLERNYRSTSSILKAANRIISYNKIRNQKNLWTDVDAGECVSIFEYDNDREEASDIISQICRKVRRGDNYNNYAILVRTNATTRLFEDQCRMNGVPYRMYGGFKFYDRKEIKDIHAYVRLIVNPRDNASFQRVVNYPARGIGDKSVSELIEFANDKEISLYEAMNLCDAKLNARFKSFIEVMQHLNDFATNHKPSEVVEEIYKYTGIKRILKLGKNDKDESATENIEELISSIVEDESIQPDLTLNEYIEGISLITSYSERDDMDAVTIATVHGVKGLEFQNVYIAAVEEGGFPIGSDDEIEEERRLMYVAVTRAKKALQISSARIRMKYGNLQYMRMSRFIKELRGDEIQHTEKHTDIREEVPKIKINMSKPAHILQNIKNTISPSSSGKDIEYVLGMTVKHALYGAGKVIEVNKIADELVVVFDQGIKKFKLDLASKFLEV